MCKLLLYFYFRIEENLLMHSSMQFVSKTKIIKLKSYPGERKIYKLHQL